MRCGVGPDPALNWAQAEDERVLLLLLAVVVSMMPFSPM
jgi:hypothetical protein